jgi:SAM-dependent methyltransferase
MADNKEQVEFWNGPGADRWVRYQEILDRSLEPFGFALLDACGAKPGERVVDVGCGCGWTSLQLAGSVGPGGTVLGVDVSVPMLDRARRRAKAGGLSNATFTVADASTHAFDATYDLVFSRFGVMFFADAVAAFENLRGALRSGGRVTFMCWGPVADNHWFRVPMAAAGSIVDLPAPTPPGEPGPFAFADRSRVEGVLQKAGFTGVRVQSAAPEYILGADVDEAATNAVETGPVARVLVEVDAPTRARAREAIREALKPYLGAEGVLLPASTWIVQARG